MHNKQTYVFLCETSLCSPSSLTYSLRCGTLFDQSTHLRDSHEALSFTIAPRHDGLRCGIISGSWPAWGYAVAACGLKLAWVLPVGRFAHWTWKFFQGPITILNGDVQAASTVDVLLIDGGLEDYSVRWRTCPAKIVISMGFPIRNLRRFWHRHTWNLSHNTIGGVSTTGVTAYGYSPYREVIKAWKTMVIPSRYSAPLHSILKCTVSSGIHVKSAVGYLSGSDHYDLDARPQVCAPCVFGGMRLRNLTREELVDVFDVPSGYVGALSPVQLDELLDNALVPLKCYSVLLMHLFVLRSGGGIGVGS